MVGGGGVDATLPFPAGLLRPVAADIFLASAFFPTAHSKWKGAMWIFRFWAYV